MSGVTRGVLLGGGIAVALGLLVALAAWIDHRRGAKRRAMQHRAAEVTLSPSFDRLVEPPSKAESEAFLAWLREGAPRVDGLDGVVERAPGVGVGEGSHLARLTPDDLDRLAELVEFRRRQDDERARARSNGHRPAPRPRGASS